MCDRTFPRAHVFGPLRVFDEHGNEHIPEGKAVRTLLLLLALNGKGVHVEQAMDVLWPNLTVREARPRIKHLLQRLPDPLSALIRREGSTLVLCAATDLEEYEAALAVVLCQTGKPLASEVLYEHWSECKRRVLAAGLLP